MEKVLSSRNANFSSMTAPEFISAIRSDFEEALEKYNDGYSKEYVLNYIYGYNSGRDYVKRSAEKFAEKKWKTEKRRNAYVEEKLRNFKYNEPYYCGLTFFDIKDAPSKMGSYSISYDMLTDETLERYYRLLMKSDWFKKAIGWKFTIDTDEGRFSYYGRPSIKLLFDPETEAAWNDARKKLEDDVMAFYSNCHYWGD